MDRETAVICMDPAIAHSVLPDRLRRRLGESVELLPDLLPADLSGGPVRGVARDVLARAGVIVSGWGCPPLEAPVLAAAPRLEVHRFVRGEKLHGEVTLADVVRVA